MRYFRQGLVSGLTILVTVFAISAVMRSIATAAIAQFASLIVGVGGMVAMGFLYRRWNGPLIFTNGGMSFGPIFRFTLGVGVILGLFRVASAIAAGRPLPIPMAIIALLLSPLSGIGLIGPMSLGSWIFDAWIVRSNKRLQTDGSPPVRRA